MIVPFTPDTKPQGWPRLVREVALDGWRKRQITVGGLRVDDQLIIQLAAPPQYPMVGQLVPPVVWQQGSKVKLDRGVRIIFEDGRGYRFALSNR